ncbi:MAG: PQQ-binding-like beta-propeller repeat protein [Ignavibacteriales bacterium]|nr:PQQ-binding-like beta-propeller repeat protein [Ignavibacteriales bacterium]
MTRLHIYSMKHSIRSAAILILCCIFSAAFSQPQKFRFAWLSDTHVGSTTGAADLGNSIRDINAMDDVAFVILSGDITEMGFDVQLDLAKAILDSLKKPYYIIPGNHDTKWSPSGCTTFSSLWGKDRFVFQYGGVQFVGMHEGPIMKMGDGHFSAEDVRWLDSILTTFPDNKPLIFVTHYPLNPEIDNWYTVTEKLKHKNTQMALVGHGHGNLAMNFEGIPGIMGRSNLRANNSTGGYTIVEVRKDSALFSERIPGPGLKQPWYALRLGPQDFSHDTSSTVRPKFTVNASYKDVRPLWTVKTGFTIASTPAVWRDYAVIGNSSGGVFCYSLKNGATEWSFKTGSTVYSTPDASEGKVVIGSSDGNIYCLEIKTGTLAWKVVTGAPVVAAAAIDEGTVYIGGSDGVFRSIDLSSGRVKWEYAGVGGFVETKPLLYKGNVVFGAWDTFLYALNAKDGSLAWKWTNGNAGILYSPAACWPVAADGKIFVVGPDRFMTAIDAGTGKTVWRSKRYQVRECVGISQDGERVYARCMTDTVVAFSSRAPTQTAVWASACGYGYDIDPSMPIEHDGEVMFGTKNGFVYALDAATGTVAWVHRIGVTIVHTPTIVDSHHILVSDLDGSLTLLEHAQ